MDREAQKFEHRLIIQKVFERERESMTKKKRKIIKESKHTKRKYEKEQEAQTKKEQKERKRKSLNIVLLENHFHVSSPPAVVTFNENFFSKNEIKPENPKTRKPENRNGYRNSDSMFSSFETIRSSRGSVGTETSARSQESDRKSRTENRLYDAGECFISAHQSKQFYCLNLIFIFR